MKTANEILAELSVERDTEGITLQQIADVTNISVAHLSGLFRSGTTVRPSYDVMIRIQNGMEQLRKQREAQR